MLMLVGIANICQDGMKHVLYNNTQYCCNLTEIDESCISLTIRPHSKVQINNKMSLKNYMYFSLDFIFNS
jgi:hypothetical protein